MSPRERFGRMGILLPVFFLIVTTVYLAEAFTIRAQFSGAGEIGPRTIPILTAILMYVALLVVLIGELRNDAPDEAQGSLLQPALVVVATFVYIFVFRPLGYFPATALYVAALFFVFGFETRRPVWFVFYVAATTLAFYALFGLVFGVRLPPVLGGLL
ncbi:Tripartite tricarboxylate transporter TctB family protein [Tranquillimonas rosea]|uniref:Tripartite tricarboxylate transporter TctB family protein n=1 Tax=Tranquillimonas rosea TaxID=641238 RepID=A0A1H9V359_9RHOB|nr:tripartite tricarboxylate transporter TctB family protein [Tranquillimonas rosea]SES15687.1 Tripartite tricarboxylate transporter TctB family protein [Tranquillimonas rosea]